MVSSGCRMRSLWFVIVISFLPNTEGKMQFKFYFLNLSELNLNCNLVYIEVARKSFIILKSSC